MSVEFTLSGNAFTAGKWNELLEKWCERQKIDVYQERYFSEEDGLAYASILGSGSVRGVLMSREKDTGKITLRYGVLASRMDWAMGFSLMGIAIKNGGGTLTRETGETYTAQMLTAKRAHQECMDDFCGCSQMIAKNIKRDGEVYIPINNFELPVTSIDVPVCTPETMPSVEKALVLRVKKYASAFPAMTMLLKGGQRIGTWALIPTVVGEVDAVGIDYHEITVPLGKLKSILGFRAESLGTTATYLPEMDVNQDRALLDSLVQENIGDEPSSTLKAPSQ